MVEGKKATKDNVDYTDNSQSDFFGLNLTDMIRVSAQITGSWKL